MSIRYTPRWPLLLALILGVGTVIGLTYATTNQSGDARPSQGGRYVEGVAGAVSQVNPLFTTSDAEDDVAKLVFAGLVRLGPKGNVQPDLAQDLPSVGPDGRTYTFKLRRGLRWQDGVRLTASDVIFTINTIKDPAFTGDPRLADVFTDVEVNAPDDQTVVMTLPGPFAPFLAFATVGILPEHRLSGLNAEQLVASPFFEQPVGSGPYRLSELTSSAAKLESYADYHFGPPLVDTIELRFYRDDALLFKALQNSEVDGAFFHTSLPPESIATIDQNAQWVRRSLHGTTYSLIYLNPELPAFQDENVRHALQHAIDEDVVINDALSGQGLPIDSPIAPDLWAYVSFPDSYTFDLNRAASLMEDAGWTRGTNGWTNEGEALGFTLATIDDPVQLRIADSVARQWREFGLQVEVHAMGASQFREEVLQQHQFEAVLSTIQPSGPDPDPYPFWHSTQALGEGLNLSGFSNSIVDQLLESARQTPSSAQRAEDYHVFQEVFSHALPALLLNTPTYQYVVTSELQGLAPGLLFSPSSRFLDVHGWFLKTESSSDGDNG